MKVPCPAELVTMEVEGVIFEFPFSAVSEMDFAAIGLPK